MPSNCGLCVNVENVRGTPRAVSFSESRDRAVIQQLDPFDGPVNAVAVADGEPGEALVFLISRGNLLPGLLLKSFEPLVKVSDGLSILFHIPVMDPVPLFDGFNEGRSELAKSDRVKVQYLKVRLALKV